MTIMMMMMIMTDPFTTNLVVKGPVVKGSVVKGATSMAMMIMMMVVMTMTISGECVSLEQRCDGVSQCRCHRRHHDHICFLKFPYQKKSFPLKTFPHLLGQGWE